jgi:hypothetical protein
MSTSKKPDESPDEHKPGEHEHEYCGRALRLKAEEGEKVVILQ